MSAILATAPASGFSAPVRDSQIAFRALLSALAAPGRMETIPAAHEAPAPIGAGLGAACLTLLDHDTPVWLDPALGSDVIAWIAFHTGAPVAHAPKQSAFAIILSPATMPPTDSFGIGTDEAPEAGTTLLIQVPDLREGRGLTWSGPGIAGRRAVGIEGLTPAFWARRHAMSDLAPRGVDVFFFAGDRVMGLPRTTRVEV